jgi:hypothetical protein
VFALVSILVGLAQSVSPPASSAEYKAMLTDSHTRTLQIFFLNNDFNLRMGI